MLTVLNVAFPFAAVGPDAVGGAEQVVFALDAALVESGQRSLVVARRGSVTGGELFPVDVPEGTIDERVRRKVWTDARAILERLLARRSVDVVHLHGVDCAEYLPDDERGPLVVTLHLSASSYPESLLARPNLVFTCVSQWQRANSGGSLRIGAVIEAGVDLQRFRPSGGAQGSFAVCLGRICPEKGYDRALRAARQAGVALAVAGGVFPYEEHERYLARTILPLLDERRRLIGPISGSQKRRLLAGARCLVVPSRSPETSSLVAMEALASGTPVIAFSVGALPSVVEHGVTGLVVSDEAELVSAFAEVRAIRREDCRRAAERRFDLHRFTAEYLAFYRSLTRRAPVASAPAAAADHAS
jgi:glycosyltransferase involved in cell wall biosynthesis